MSQEFDGNAQWYDGDVESAESEVFDAIAREILDCVETSADGTVRLPWHLVTGGRPRNAFTGRPFRGTNVLRLWTAARKRDFPEHQWASESAWQRYHGKVKPGEVGTPILVPVFDFQSEPKRWEPWQAGIKKRVGRLGGDPNGGEFRRLLRYEEHPWFNVHQVDGVKLEPASVPTPSAAAAAVVQLQKDWQRHKGPVLVLGGGMAHWRPDVDRIHMPAKDAFGDAGGLSGEESFAAVMAHEMVHATGSVGRLDRECSQLYFKNIANRAQEELIAELGAAFLGGTYGLGTALRSDHAQYVKSWLTKLRSPEETRSFFRAVVAAEDGVEFVIAAAQGRTPAPREVRKAKKKAQSEEAPPEVPERRSPYDKGRSLE